MMNNKELVKELLSAYQPIEMSRNKITTLNDNVSWIVEAKEIDNLGEKSIIYDLWVRDGDDFVMIEAPQDVIVAIKKSAEEEIRRNE